LCLSIIRVVKQTVVIIEAYHFCELWYKILYKILLSRLTPLQQKILIINADFDAAGHLLIIYLAFARY
jgi:hypothetical protein